MRSFHANEEDGEESACASLGFSQKEVDVCKFYILLIFIQLFFFHLSFSWCTGCNLIASDKILQDIQNFYCKNCEYNQHQCFACGTLGCSDKFSGAEV